MRRVQPRVGDVLLLLLMAFVVASTVVNLGTSLAAIIAADDLTTPLWSLAVNVPLAAIFVVWVGLGAWRRTVWGCVLVAHAGTCERHGGRCRQAASADEGDQQATARG
ncbi:MAG: hypothetical protein ACI867_001182 [Glaciecola sp.]|jgi:hypothetical protein